MKIVLDKGAIMPTRAHPYDAGLDLYTPINIMIPAAKRWPFFDYGRGLFLPEPSTAVGTATIDTGVHVEIPEGYVGFIKSKSGLSIKHKISAEGGVIDSHYTGSIVVKLSNYSTNEYYFRAGDKIAQLVILPCLLPELEQVDSLEDTERGEGGFGSTGR